jgi:hypothetical protein
MKQEVSKVNKDNPGLWPITITIVNENKKEEVLWQTLKKDIRIVIDMLKDKCHREESSETRNSIQKAIQQRCLDLKDNQKRMINSCINRHREKIVIDRIKIKNTNGSEYITTNPQKIQKEVEKYHKEAFQK